MSRVDITFVRDYQVKDAEHRRYKKGDTLTVNESSARHFIARGAAVEGKPERERKGRGAAKKDE